MGHLILGVGFEGNRKSVLGGRGVSIFETSILLTQPSCV
jgi:hypothetical protein